ncbi:MAG: hypothetical protein ABR903_05435 [Thermodesulfovibrionales bacterium]
MEKILIVDDNEAVRMFMQQALNTKDLEVAAADGVHARPWRAFTACCLKARGFYDNN